MDEAKLKDAGFIAFIELVTSTLGSASTEVLYAWYYNTFNQKSNKKKDESEGK